MYKRNKNTVILDLKFIKNKGIFLNIKELYHLTIEVCSGTLVEINKNKKNISKDKNNIVLYNITFIDIFKAIEIEKYWNGIENNNSILMIKGDCFTILY